MSGEYFHRTPCLQEFWWLKKSQFSSRPFVIVVMAVGLLFPDLVLARESNPWGRAVGEAIALRDVSKDMRNRSERLFPRSAVAYLAIAQNECACQILDAMQGGAPGPHITGLLRTFQVIQSKFNQAICGNRIASSDHGLKNYRRLVEDRLLDLTRDLERCTPPHEHCYSSYRFEEQSFLPSVPQSFHIHPQVTFPVPGFGQAVEF
jgi:hypothetical protein